MLLLFAIVSSVRMALAKRSWFSLFFDAFLVECISPTATSESVLLLVAFECFYSINLYHFQLKTHISLYGVDAMISDFISNRNMAL
jgi:hypothetical protein